MNQPKGPSRSSTTKITMGSQHPSPNVKTLSNSETNFWPEIVTSRDAESTCFKGSRTSCDVIFLAFFFKFWPEEITFRERPPGLILHVLTVLVFGSWVLLLLRPPASSQSLRLFPRASILLHGPLDIGLHLLPAAPPPPGQKQDTQHVFFQHRGAEGNKKCKKLHQHFLGPFLL